MNARDDCSFLLQILSWKVHNSIGKQKRSAWEETNSEKELCESIVSRKKILMGMISI